MKTVATMELLQLIKAKHFAQATIEDVHAMLQGYEPVNYVTLYEYKNGFIQVKADFYERNDETDEPTVTFLLTDKPEQLASDMPVSDHYLNLDMQLDLFKEVE